MRRLHPVGSVWRTVEGLEERCQWGRVRERKRKNKKKAHELHALSGWIDRERQDR